MDLLETRDVSHVLHRVSRRELIRLGLITVASALVPRSVFASDNEPLPQQRKLSFYHLHTQENLNTVYWKDGNYIPGALSEINSIFRDTRTDRVKAINKDLLDLLFSIQQKLKCEEPFHIVSGYRSPGTNAILRKTNKGVAKNSLHMYGKAVDISVPGYNLKTVKQTAMSLKRGGVGYYPRSKFIHIDVGPVRYWWG